VSPHLDLRFDLGLGRVLPSSRKLQTLLAQPTRRPVYEIGGKCSQVLLEKESRGRADFQVMHGEHVFAFFDASFDQLASIVALKPAREIGRNWIATEVDERTVTLGLTGLETLQAHIQRVGEVNETFCLPGDQLGVFCKVDPVVKTRE